MGGGREREAGKGGSREIWEEGERERQGREGGRRRREREAGKGGSREIWEKGERERHIAGIRWESEI